MSKEYNIGIYIRLSMADEDTGYGSKAESDSIGNQRMPVSYTHLDVYKRQLYSGSSKGLNRVNLLLAASHVIDASPSALVIASQRIMLTPIFPLPVRSSPS